MYEGTSIFNKIKFKNGQAYKDLFGLMEKNIIEWNVVENSHILLFSFIKTINGTDGV